MGTAHAVVDSPLGELTLAAEDGALTGVYFADHRRRPDRAAFGGRISLSEADGPLVDAARQLGEYFAGERTGFALRTAPRGDAFERRVWALLSEVPHGQTRSYGDLARELGDPALAQAVGAANSRNPLCVVVPCHRVVGSDGSLTGYAGGLARKRYLLDLEAPAAARLF